MKTEYNIIHQTLLPDHVVGIFRILQVQVAVVVCEEIGSEGPRLGVVLL